MTRGLRQKWRPGDNFLVRHRDDTIVVVEKRAGILTVPTPARRGEDLLHLLGAFLSGRREERRRQLFPVHRLDRAVSGLLVFARRHDAREALIEQFKEHTVERVYVAAVQGNLRKDSGTFAGWLAEDEMKVRVVEEGQGKRAVTHYRVIERFPDAGVTLVEVRLETGLRNQIRVHFAHAGHPLLGERKYLPEGAPRARSRQGTERLFLHAAVLGFTHPMTGRRMRFEADLPRDLTAWKKRFGGARTT